METKAPSTLETKLAQMRKHRLAANDLFSEIALSQQTMLDNLAASVGQNNKRLGSVITVQKQLRSATEEQAEKIERNEQALLSVASEAIDTDLETQPMEPTDVTETQPTQPTQPIVSMQPTRTTPSQLPTARILLVVGHNAIVQGAWSKHLQQTEYDYNLQLARSLEGSYEATDDEGVATNAEVFIKYRDENITRQEFAIETIAPFVSREDIDMVVEMHFNSFTDESVGGTETLRGSTGTDQVALITKFHNAMVETLNLRDRGIKRLLPNDRGYTNVTSLQGGNSGFALSHIPYCIMEPFFGSNSKDCYIAVRDLYDAYYNAILAVATEIGERKLVETA